MSDNLDHLLTLDELSTYLNVPKSTLYQWRTRGQGPAGIRVGKYVRYRRSTVEAWLDEQPTTTQADRLRRGLVEGKLT